MKNVPYVKNRSADYNEFLGKCLEKDSKKRFTIDQVLEHPFIKNASEYNISAIQPSQHVSTEEISWDL